MNKSRWSSWMKSISRFVGVGQNKSWRGKCPLLRTRSPQLEPLEQRQMLTILYWDPIPDGGVGGSGTWSTDPTSCNWNTASDGSESRVAWIDGADAVFAGDAGTVSILGTVSPNSIQFDTTAYSIASGTLALPVANTEILVQTDVTATISSTIAGTGGMSKTGTGALNLTGGSANIYGGSTSISAGSLWLEKASGAAAIPGDIHFNGTLNTYVYLGASEQIADSAVLYFNNTSNHGRFWLYGHTETVAGINTSNGRGVIQNVQSESGANDPGTLIVNNTVDCHYAGYLRDKASGDSTGTVSLVKQGTGKLTLSGENIYYTGTTTIDAGTLQIGNGGTTGTLGTGDVTVDSDAELRFYRTDSYSSTITISNDISGSGLIGFYSSTASNTGAYQLTGANTGFTGTINIDDARVKATSAANLGSASASIHATGGGQIYVTGGTFNQSLRLGGIGDLESAGNLGALRLGGNATWTGNITLVADTRVTAYRSTGTISGTITGDHYLYAWSGSSPNGDTITLAPGSSTNIGQLRVGVGTTVVAGNTNALKTNMTLVMQGGTFKLNGLNLATSGLYGTSGNIQNGSDTTAATLTVQRNAGDVTYSGTFTDGGSAAFGLTKTGSSMLTLTGTNTYSGTTTVSAGTLRLGNGTTDGSIAGDIVNNATLVFNNASARTYAGDISGTGSVTKSAAGTLTLSGSGIAYTGGTTVSAGTLVLQNTTDATFLTKNIVTNAALEFDWTNVNSTFSGVISGSGGLVKTGAYALTLGGSTSNTYTGVTTVNEGRLRLNKSGGATAVPGDVVFEGSYNCYLYLDASEQIADTSMVYFNNTSSQGRLCLNGQTETIAGLETVAPDRGVVQNVQTDSGVSANGTLIVNSSSNVFFDGYIRDRGADNSTGGVSLVKQGTGTLTLAGANITYTGGTTLSQGTLVLQDTTNSTFLTKNILVNGTLEFATVNASPTFNGQLSGNGTVVKSGSRNLALGGANSFTGEIHVNAGRLRDVTGPANFGSPSGIHVNPGGQIYTYNDDEYDFPLSIAGNGHSESAGYLGALRLYNGSTWAGDITLTGDARITAYDAMATITGNISDGDNGYQLTFCSGNGGYPASGIYLEPSSDNSWTGGTLIAGAIVQLKADDALPDGGEVTLGHPTLGAGGLDLNGHDLTVSSLATGAISPSHSTFWDEVSNTSGTPAKLTVVYNNDNDDEPCVYAGVLSGNLKLEKYGSGWLKLAGRNYSIGDADVYNGTLDIRVSYRGAVEAHDTGVALLPEIAWYTITLSDKSGDAAGSFADTFTEPSHPVGVLGDWQDAVIDSVEGAVGIQHFWFTPIYTFGEFYGGSLGPTGQAYRVGTVAELNAAVKAMHNNQDVFGLDYALPADKKLIVLESMLGYASCDYDYDDVYWEVTADKIGMSLDASPTTVDRDAEYTLTLGPVTGISETITGYTIHWGDGSDPETYTAAEMAALDREVTHVFADGGYTRTITVDVTIDNTSVPVLTSVASKSVTVLHVAPDAAIVEDSLTYYNNQFHCGVILTMNDLGDNQVLGWTVNWGDGITASWPHTSAPDGALVRPYEDQTCWGISHVYASEGDYVITFTVTDQNGEWSDYPGHEIAISMEAAESTPPEDGSSASLTLTSSGDAYEGHPHAVTIELTEGSNVPSSWVIDWRDGSGSTVIPRPDSWSESFDWENEVLDWGSGLLQTGELTWQATHTYADDGQYQFEITCGPGDANFDGTANEADAAILAANWGRSNATWAQGDFNGDGMIGDGDADSLVGHWGATSHAGTHTVAVANVPATGVMLHPDSVAENLAGVVVGILFTDDPGKNDEYTYELLDDADGKFVVEGNTIRLADGVALDYESATHYVIRVQAEGEDAADGTVTSDITIHVEDVVSSMTIFGEGDAYTSGANYMLHLRAEDLDDYTWEIHWGDGHVDNNVVLTGGAAACMHVYHGGLYRDVFAYGTDGANEFYSNVLRLRNDNPQLAITGTKAFQLNVDPPVPAANPISPPVDAYLGALAACYSGGDSLASPRWEIVSGNPRDAFRIDPATGELFVNHPEYLVFENKVTYVLEVVVHDGSVSSYPETITVTFMDTTYPGLNRAPVIVRTDEDWMPAQVFTGGYAGGGDIPLGFGGMYDYPDPTAQDPTSPGMLLGTVDAFDPDGNDLINWTISDPSGAFWIDPNTGELYQVAPALDWLEYYRPTNLSGGWGPSDPFPVRVGVGVSDGLAYDTAEIEIWITNIHPDEPSEPYIPTQVFYVDENTQTGEELGTIQVVGIDPAELVNPTWVVTDDGMDEGWIFFGEPIPDGVFSYPGGLNRWDAARMLTVELRDGESTVATGTVYVYWTPQRTADGLGIFFHENLLAEGELIVTSPSQPTNEEMTLSEITLVKGQTVTIDADRIGWWSFPSFPEDLLGGGYTLAYTYDLPVLSTHIVGVHEMDSPPFEQCIGIFTGDPNDLSNGKPTYTFTAKEVGVTTLFVRAKIYNEDYIPGALESYYAGHADLTIPIRVVPAAVAHHDDRVAIVEDPDEPYSITITVPEDIGLVRWGGLGPYFTHREGRSDQSSSTTCTFFVIEEVLPGRPYLFSTAPRLNPATGSLTFAPAPDRHGQAVFTIKEITVDDGDPSCWTSTPRGTLTINVTPVDESPEWQYDVASPQYVYPGQAILLEGLARDISPGSPFRSPAQTNLKWDLDGDDLFGELGAAARYGNEVGQYPTFHAAVDLYQKADYLEHPYWDVRVGEFGNSATAVIHLLNDTPGVNAGDDVTIPYTKRLVRHVAIDDAGPGPWLVEVDHAYYLGKEDEPGYQPDASFFITDPRKLGLGINQLFDEHGEYVVRVKVTDANGLSGEDSFIVTVTNAPPVFQSTPVTEALVGHEYEYKVHAFDPEGGPVEYTWASATIDDIPVVGFTCSSDGVVTWTPIQSDLGKTVDVVLQATDEQGAVGIQAYSILVTTDWRNLDPYIWRDAPNSFLIPNNWTSSYPNVSPGRIGLNLANGQVSEPVDVSVSLNVEAVPVDVLFLVDESGSMAFGHEWLWDIDGAEEGGGGPETRGVVEYVDDSLRSWGFANIRYGLIGFGNSTAVPRGIAIGDSQLAWGSAQELATAAADPSNGLVTNGELEDGYAAIQWALNTKDYEFRAGSVACMVMITDEARSVLDDYEDVGFSEVVSSLRENAEETRSDVLLHSVVIGYHAAAGDQNEAVGDKGVFLPVSGSWTAAPLRYAGKPTQPNQAAISLVDFDSYPFQSIYDETETLDTTITFTDADTGRGLLVFNHVAMDDYRFAGLDLATNTWVIGSSTGSVVDGVLANVTLRPGVPYTMRVSCEWDANVAKSTVTLFLNGHEVAAHEFEGTDVRNGGIGVGAEQGEVAFGLFRALQRWNGEVALIEDFTFGGLPSRALGVSHTHESYVTEPSGEYSRHVRGDYLGGRIDSDSGTLHFDRDNKYIWSEWHLNFPNRFSHLGLCRDVGVFGEARRASGGV